MTKYKTQLILLFTSLTLILSLSGCWHKKSDDENTIKFWHFWSEPYQRVVVDSLVKVFERQNNATVEVTELSWADGKVKLMAAFNSETAPDVLELGSDWVAQFSSAGVLADITDRVDTEKYLDFAMEPAMWQGKVFALPWIVDTRVMFVNMDLLKVAGYDQPPKDFQEMVDMAKAVNINGNYGFGVNGSDRHRLYKKVLSYIWSEGGAIYEDGKFVFDSEEVISAIGKYKEIGNYGLVGPQKELDKNFAQGKIAFWISGSWLMKKIDSFDKIDDLRLIEMPDMAAKGMSFAGGEYLTIDNRSENKELATKFVKFMTDGKNSIEFCKKIPEGGFPADREYYSKKFYDNEYKAVFASQLTNSKMTPVHPDWLEIEEIFEHAVELVLYDKMTSRESMIQLQKKVEDM
ncbi:MAG: extracellular solute-binding protein [Chlorobiota bacterium]